MKFAEKPATCAELLKQHKKTVKVYETSKITFKGAEGADVYNISAPFTDNGKTYIAGRVEKRDSEISSIRFFEKTGRAEYKAAFDKIELKNMQDPFIARFGGNLVLGGTQIDVSPLDSEKIVGWRTLFMKGKDIPSLDFWTTGPHKMKDVRICETKQGLVIFSRPQGYEAGWGKIGRTVLKNQDWFDSRTVLEAKLFDTHFIDGEWGGANEIHILKNGRLGVLGHIACMHPDKSKHYYSMAFCYDIAQDKCTPVKIIAERKDFKEGPAKRGDLIDVLFSGGIIRLPDGKAELYTGVSDAEAHYIVINDPFTEYEG